MQRLIYGTVFTVTFADTIDIGLVEEKIDALMTTPESSHGWLILNHPDEAGTQVKLSVTRGLPIMIVRQEGAPIVAGDGSVSNWVFTNGQAPAWRTEDN